MKHSYETWEKMHTKALAKIAALKKENAALKKRLNKVIAAGQVDYNELRK